MNDERRCFTSSFIVHGSSFRAGGDEGSRTLIVRFTRPTLCYPVELHRHLKLVDREGFKPSQEVCRTSMLSVTSPARKVWWLWVELNHQPRAYETLALIPLELHSQESVSSLKFQVCVSALETLNLQLET